MYKEPTTRELITLKRFDIFNGCVYRHLDAYERFYQGAWDFKNLRPWPLAQKQSGPVYVWGEVCYRRQSDLIAAPSNTILLLLHSFFASLGFHLVQMEVLKPRPMNRIRNRNPMMTRIPISTTMMMTTPWEVS